MKDIIIFGRSPFINELKLDKIDYNKFDVLCINYPICGIKVHFVVSADVWVVPKLAPKTEWISLNTGWQFKKTDSIIQGEKQLSWLHYSSSLAVNFAILKGYKNIYLAGVDLKDGEPFKHYDGIINSKKASGCIEEREYIKKLMMNFNVNIFQVNPKCDWLKCKDIGLL